MIIWVALAGGVGACARYLSDEYVKSVRAWSIPAGTISVNIIGSFLLGLVHALGPAPVSLIVGTGFCGGFTTFSTASVDAVRLLESKQRRSSLLYISITVASCLVSAGIGLALGSALRA